VTAVELGYGADAGLEVRVRAYDALHHLRKRQSVRGFADLELSDLAGRLVGPIGLSVNARDAGARRRQLVQWRQSDLALLSDTAAAAGLYFFSTADSLELFPLSGAGGAAIDLRLGDELYEAAFEINGDEAVDAISAVAWDPTTGRRFEESAGEARSGRTAGARVAVADLGGEPTRIVANVVARDAADARALAQGGLDRVVAGRVVLRGVAAGHAGIRPGASVGIGLVAPAFTGEYLVTEAVHSLDAERGYLTAFNTAPPASAPGAGIAPVLAPGIVERVDDPDERGRVAVSLPTFPSIETEWMRVLLPAVGPRAGLVALPAKGDEVLVVFPSGDLSAGVVLGGLFAGDEPHDFGVVKGAVRRYSWRTREGQRVELDEANHRLRLAIPNGTAITLGRERLSIHSATDLEIAAPGRTIVIKAKAVDFQRAESS